LKEAGRWPLKYCYKLDFENSIEDRRGSISINLKRGSVCVEYFFDGCLLLSNKGGKLLPQICIL
jgi:hypothetical protein